MDGGFQDDAVYRFVVVPEKNNFGSDEVLLVYATVLTDGDDAVVGDVLDDGGDFVDMPRNEDFDGTVAGFAPSVPEPVAFVASCVV